MPIQPIHIPWLLKTYEQSNYVLIYVLYNNVLIILLFFYDSNSNESYLIVNNLINL